MMKNYFVDTKISEHLCFKTKKTSIEKDYDDTFLLPQTPTAEALKTDFDHPITNLIVKTNNIIEMVPMNEKQDLDKYGIHLS